MLLCSYFWLLFFPQSTPRSWGPWSPQALGPVTENEKRAISESMRLTLHLLSLVERPLHFPCLQGHILHFSTQPIGTEGNKGKTEDRRKGKQIKETKERKTEKKKRKQRFINKGNKLKNATRKTKGLHIIRKTTRKKRNNKNMEQKEKNRKRSKQENRRTHN